MEADSARTTAGETKPDMRTHSQSLRGYMGIQFQVGRGRRKSHVRADFIPSGSAVTPCPTFCISARGKRSRQQHFPSQVGRTAGFGGKYSVCAPKPARLSPGLFLAKMNQRVAAVYQSVLSIRASAAGRPLNLPIPTDAQGDNPRRLAIDAPTTDGAPNL